MTFRLQFVRRQINSSCILAYILCLVPRVIKQFLSDDIIDPFLIDVLGSNRIHVAVGANLILVVRPKTIVECEIMLLLIFLFVFVQDSCTFFHLNAADAP